MAGVSGYRILRPVALGAQDNAWEVASADGRDGLILERCDPSSEWMRDEAGDPLRLFLERRSLQKKLAEKAGGGSGLGGGHIAPVRELGVDGTGGYAVRDRYDLSVGDLIRGQTRPRGDLLHEIVAGTVTALGAIETYGGRPHGELDGDALLLRDLRPGRLGVGIRHPLPARLLGEDLAAVRRDELRRLGLLIYQLVTGQAFRELGGYPVRDGPAWRALGPNHAFWLRLVNELLDPKSPTLTLGDVVSRVEGLKYTKQADGPRWGRWVAVAAVIVVVGAGGWFLWPRPEPGPTYEFDEAAFKRWYRVTPAVEKLRASLKELESDELEAALGPELVATSDAVVRGMKDRDVFDGIWVLRLLQSRAPSISSERRPAFEDEVLAAYAELPGQSVDDSELTTDQRKARQDFNNFAEVIVDGLAVIDGATDDPSDDLVAELSAESWGARKTLESQADAYEAKGWAGVAADLRAPGAAAAEAARALLTPDTEAETEAYWSGLDVEARFEALADAVEETERLALRTEAWGSEAFGELEHRANGLAARAEWGGLDGAIASRAGTEGLPGTDPVLASLPAIAGVLGEGVGLEGFRARLERFGLAIGAVGSVVDGTDWWRGVDLLALRGAMESGEAAYPDGPFGGGDTEAVGSWLAVVEAWAGAAEGARVAGGAGWSFTADELVTRRAEHTGAVETWAEVERSARAEGEEEARAALDRIGWSDRSVERLLGEIGETLDAVEAAPAWPSLRGAVDGLYTELAETLDKTKRVVDDVANRVLKTPEEKFAEWEDERLDLPDSVGAQGEEIRALRDRVGASLMADWRAWAADSGLDEDGRNASDESAALKTGLENLDAVLERAAGAIDDAARTAEVRGGFDRSLIEPRLRAALAGSVLGALDAEAYTLWGDDAAARAGGRLDEIVEGAMGGVAEAFAAFSGDLDRLDGLRRDVAGWEMPDRGASLSVAESRALLDALENRHGAFMPAASGPAGPGLDETHPGEVAGLVRGVVGTLGSDDVGGLLATASAEGDAGPHHAVRYAAVERAGELGGEPGVWPSDVAGMPEQGRRLAAAVAALESAFGDGAGSAERLEQVKAVLFGWWSRGFEIARRESEIGVLVDGPAEWFGSLDQEWTDVFDAGRLSGVARYNHGVYGVREELRGLVAAAEGMDELDAAFTADVRARIDRVRALASGAGVGTAWLGGFDTALNEFSRGGSIWDEKDNGPGKIGWSAQLNDRVSPHRLTYNSGGRSIEFVLVERPDGGKEFLATEEFSVGMMGEVVSWLHGDRQRWNAGGAAKRIRDWLGEASSDRRWVGPRPWSVMSNRFEVRVSAQASGWLDIEGDALIGDKPGEVLPYAEPLRDAGDPTRLPSSQRPTEGHPMTRVDHAVASAAAEVLGCVLPSERTYQAVLGGAQSGSWNLRDATVRTQWDYVKGWEQNAKKLYSPGESSYDPDAATERVTPGADGVLWFRGVGDQPDAQPLKNLIGNVAEFIAERPAVIGGSALSSPDTPVTRAIECGAGIAYDDTGFRLAIPADDYGNLASELERQLRDTVGTAYVFGGG